MGQLISLEIDYVCASLVPEALAFSAVFCHACVGREIAVLVDRDGEDVCRCTVLSVHVFERRGATSFIGRAIAIPENLAQGERRCQSCSASAVRKPRSQLDETYLLRAIAMMHVELQIEK